MIFHGPVTTSIVLTLRYRRGRKGTLFSVPGREYSRGDTNLCPCTSWRWKPGERYIDDAVDIYEKVTSFQRVIVTVKAP